MASSRRHPRHQGVRYGPPRERQRFSENGVLVGRMVGLGILLLTMGVLAAGAVAFIGERPRVAPSPPRSSSVAFGPSPTTSVAATLLPTVPPSIALPTATAVAPGTATAQPLASVPPPQVQIGEGFVTFGTQSDSRLHILDPRASFSINERIVWSAYLSQRADSAELRVHIFKVDGTPPTGERLIADEAVSPLVRGAQIFERSIRPPEILEGPGIYVVRYVRGTDILSQGSLEITG